MVLNNDISVQTGLEPHLTEESHFNGAIKPYKHGYEPMAHEHSIKHETNQQDIAVQTVLKPHFL